MQKFHPDGVRYPDLGSASDWLCHKGIFFQPVRSATKIWIVMHHQYGISALVTQTSFCEGSSGDLAKHPAVFSGYLLVKTDVSPFD